MTDGDVTLRAVFHDYGSDMSIRQFDYLFGGLETLIWTAIHPVIVSETEFGGFKVSDTLVGQQSVRSVRYSSPLEVVFTISASTTVLAGAGFTLLRLWDKFQESRTKTAAAGAAVSAYEVVREHMNLARIGAEENEAMQRAAGALEWLDRLEVVDEHGDPQTQ